MNDGNLELPLTWSPPAPPRRRQTPLARELEAWREFGQTTRQWTVTPQSAKHSELAVPAYVNEFWTARQRQASSLHEVSYRACFKPQLPRFFIERLTDPGDRVYDPFMGRGTTPLEAALMGRVPIGCDINPLSQVFVRPRLRPPLLSEVEERLRQIDFSWQDDLWEELFVFFHPETLKQIVALRRYLAERRQRRTLDALDEWIELVALNRLTGHSPGFFSVYTLPPNQAVSLKSQLKINERRKQTPTPRDVPKLILKKSKQLLGDCTPAVRQTLERVAGEALLLTAPADRTPEIADNSVHLVVTSPPFLNVVQYATDNWLRCWFIGLEADRVQLTVPSKLDRWQEAMTGVFHELRRILRPGGHVAFEVGEVNKGKTKLEEVVIACGLAAGLEPLLVLINDQEFTKTANCWGVDNMAKGTNTNRITVLRKP